MSESQEDSNREDEDLTVAAMRTASDEAKLNATMEGIKLYLHKA